MVGHPDLDLEANWEAEAGGRGGQWWAVGNWEPFSQNVVTSACPTCALTHIAHMPSNRGHTLKC